MRLRQHLAAVMLVTAALALIPAGAALAHIGLTALLGLIVLGLLAWLTPGAVHVGG